MSAAGGHTRSLRWLGPVVAWAAMMGALVVIVLIAVGSEGAVRFYGALALSAVMLTTLAFGLAGIGRESALVRLVGCTAFLFIALMFVLSFNDLLTRLR
jgi:hypothetical protein